MARDRGTFDSYHRPVRSTTGRTRREVQDRASFDNQPAQGCGAMLLLTLATLAVLGVLVG